MSEPVRVIVAVDDKLWIAYSSAVRGDIFEWVWDSTANHVVDAYAATRIALVKELDS